MEARSGNGVGGPRARTGGHFLYRLQHTQPSQQLFVQTWCEESAWSISLLIHRVLQWILTIPIYSSSLRGPVTYTINTHNTKKSVLQYAERWEECRAGEDRWWERRNAAQCATQTAASWRGHGTGGERTERWREGGPGQRESKREGNERRMQKVSSCCGGTAHWGVLGAA